MWHIYCWLLCFAYLIVDENAEARSGFWMGRHKEGNLGSPSSVLNVDSSLPPDEWFEQNLDHFDPTNNRTWKQRFFTNVKFFRGSGPVFLMIGGEGAATAKWMVQGAWIQYAKENNALCFQLEHRFYGKSHPTEDLSTDNLVYLNSEQALADLAFFVVRMNAHYNLSAETKWIAFGGSYPGSLAAWFREKYPHLVHGAISSSGPLLAKINFYEYYDVVAASLRTYSDKCVSSVQRAFAQTEILLKHMIGQRSLSEKFMLCDPLEKSIENQLDLSNFFENLASNFAGVVQYNKDNSEHASATIDNVCDLMVNETMGAPVVRLAAVNKLMLAEQKQKCLDFRYDKMVQDIQNTSWSASAAEGSRQWTYQTCTEFGFYQTSDNTERIFGDRFPADFFIKQCTDFFGLKFNAISLANAVDRTNVYYGALRPSTSNVIFVHGSIDPWHALGLTETKNSEMPTIYINGTAHCANMYEPREMDLPQLKDARTQIRSFIAKILK